MSVSSYRSALERATKERSQLEKEKARCQSKIADLVRDIGDLQRNVARTSSASSKESYARRLESKLRDLAKEQSALGGVDDKLSRALADIHRSQDSLQRAEQQEQRKRDDTDKKRRRDEERHATMMVRRAREQASVHREIASVPLRYAPAQLPTEISVLFLAVDPTDTSNKRLRLDEEIRLIDEQIRKSKHRDSVKLVSHWAVRSGDLLEALNRHEPHVVHFSGHGSPDGLWLQNPDGSGKFVSNSAIAATLRTATENLQLVVFNACFSAEQAAAITEHLDAFVGMNDAISDEAARIFAGAFYGAIGYGRSLRVAFEQAIAAVMLEGIDEKNTPELHVRDGISAEDIFLVRSSAPGGVVSG